MPTVSYSCPTSGKKMKKSFPYNAVGKAQAVEFAKMNKGNIKNNPGPYMETQTPSSGGENRPISDLGLTPEKLRKGGSIPVGGSGIKGAIKVAAKVFGKLRKK
jgi:hypothetical protein